MGQQTEQLTNKQTNTYSQPPDRDPSYKTEASPQCQRLEDIRAASDAPIHRNRHSVLGYRGTGPQCIHRRRHAV